MPYKSTAQSAYMHIHHPSIAARWDKEYPNQKGLPKHVKKKKANHLLAGPLSHLIKESEDVQGGPPHYRPADHPGISCGSCQHFQSTGTGGICTKYSGYPVVERAVCDGFEEKNIDPTIEAPPDNSPGVDFNFQQGGLGGLKMGKTKRPDRYGEFNNWMANITHHPTTISGTMTTPVSTAMLAAGHEPHPSTVMGDHPQSRIDGHVDAARLNDMMDHRHRMSSKQAFKAGFLLRCAEERLDLPQIEQKVDKLLEKKAFLGGILGKVLGFGSYLGRKITDVGVGAAIGAPVVLGGAGGYALAKARSAGAKEDIEDMKHEEMRNEYMRLADAARRKTKIKQMQEQDPGSIVQLS